MNIRSLFNFFNHRCCNRAQWEIRAVAEEMYKLCVSVAPTIFKHTGPSCVVKGKCPEGKMSCGKMYKMKDKYAYFIETSENGSNI
jgi:thymidylate synthase (FAD)